MAVEIKAAEPSTSTRESAAWAAAGLDDGSCDEPESGRLLPITAAVRSEFKVLVVDPDPVQCETCAQILESEGYRVGTCTRGAEAEHLVRRGGHDIVVIDLEIHQPSGLDLVRECVRANPETTVIAVSSASSVLMSEAALRAGAWEFLPKPFSAVHLQLLIERAVYRHLQRRRVNEARAKLDAGHGRTKGMVLLGESEAFLKVVDLARRVAPTDASVMLSGESGTGKEMIAQFIHKCSRRARKPFVAVNCAALPESLLESEMFGYRKGAFTGAIHDKPGLLETANGGTMFLDELTEMAPAIQAKLLRVIQNGEIRRVGSSTTDVVVDARFISATNRDPLEAIEEGVLRSDLYYRLRVVPIRIPPLRERPEDIPVLARHFLLSAWFRHRKEGLEPPELTDAAIRALQARPWPGNVRELQNVIEHAAVLVEPGCRIQPEHLPSLEETPQHRSATTPIPGNFGGQAYHAARSRLLSEFERGYLEWLVREADGNMSEAARIAGVDRTTLYRLMEKHEFDRWRGARAS